ncbi:MAG: SMP-30/gluconolactonase/LRE family protein [Alphaproteobacteria bacterium]
MNEFGGGVTVAANTEDVLGEVPVWDAAAGRLWWTDVFRPAIHRLDAASGKVESWTPPDKVHSFALREAGGLVIAGRKGFALYDPENETYELLHDPREDREGTLLNDGRTDRQGRFWAGSMDKMLKRPSGHLYRLDADHQSFAMADGITLSNGMAFSPDGGTLYCADSLLKNIFSFDLDTETGGLANKRVFAETGALPGIPDGATVDAEGYLWSARFDGGRVLRHAPDGSVVQEIAFPVSRVTSCALGGADLKTLYVTSAFFRLTDEQRAAEPLAGALFAVKVDVPGLPEPRYRG